MPNSPADVKKTTPWATSPAAMNSSRPQEMMKNHLRLLMVRPLQFLGGKRGRGWRGGGGMVCWR